MTVVVEERGTEVNGGSGRYGDYVSHKATALSKKSLASNATIPSVSEAGHFVTCPKVNYLHN